MMDTTELRIIALMGLFALGNACMIALIIIWRSGVRSFRLTHIPLLMTVIACLTITALMLAISSKEHALVSRVTLTPLIALTEWGALIAGWAWYAYAAKASFCIVHRHEVRC
jgi:hypothetical protein